MSIKTISELTARVDKFVSERDWEQFHTPKNLAIGLSIESNELLEIFQWLKDEETLSLPEEKFEHVKEEIADVLIYLTRLSSLMKIDLLDAAEKKLAKNAVKYPPELVRGSAKKYTEYDTGS